MLSNVCLLRAVVITLHFDVRIGTCVTWYVDAGVRITYALHPGVGYFLSDLVSDWLVHLCGDTSLVCLPEARLLAVSSCELSSDAWTWGYIANLVACLIKGYPGQCDLSSHVHVCTIVSDKKDCLTGT